MVNRPALSAPDEEGYDRSFAVNLKGPFFLLQALLPIFAKPATIVLNTSINAHLGMPNSSIYAANHSRAPLARSHPLGRASAARHPRERRQPWSDRNPLPRQARHGRDTDHGLGRADSRWTSWPTGGARQGGRFPRF